MTADELNLSTARSTLIAAILSLGTVEQTAPVIGALVAYIESLAALGAE